ncbi:MAG: PQQ-dependent sugar dehydrogenase [Burkholderiaceae bacterium]
MPPHTPLAALLAVTTLTAAIAAQATTPRPEVVAKDLAHPWGLAFLPDGRFLMTERPGRLRVVEANGRVGTPVAGVPPVAAQGQGGLLDVVTDSAFAQNRTVYLCYSEPDTLSGRTNSTALVSAHLSDDGTRLEGLRVLFSQRPKVASSAHFGCRIVESGPTLFLTLGDRFRHAADAQTLDNHHGKVVRVLKNGGVPPDNPFALKPSPSALPEIWSWGHRNVQGATLGPDGQLWTHEHGPQGGDEINRPQAGQNHGWPVVSFGKHYGGATIGEGLTEKPGLQPPLHHWTPSIAPSGMAFVTSDRYGPAWKGSLMVGSLKFGYLARLTLANGQVVAEERLLQDRGQRVRDVRQGPDGLLYVLTDSPRVSWFACGPELPPPAAEI